ncbi:hypothetical protein BDQ17DRAFT_204561 [Cyathus striatus]|nr:hypothetical protein BDQ17DRAFT_204561 [Cyathus striatus]
MKVQRMNEVPKIGSHICKCHYPNQRQAISMIQLRGPVVNQLDSVRSGRQHISSPEKPTRKIVQAAVIFAFRFSSVDTLRSGPMDPIPPQHMQCTTCMCTRHYPSTQSRPDHKPNSSYARVRFVGPVSSPGYVTHHAHMYAALHYEQRPNHRLDLPSARLISL